MNQALKALGVVALVAALLSPIAYVLGAISLPACKATTLVATIVWFGVAAMTWNQATTAVEQASDVD